MRLLPIFARYIMLQGLQRLGRVLAVCVILLSAFVCPCMLFADEVAEYVTDSVDIRFRKGYSQIEMRFENNAGKLERFVEAYNRYMVDSTLTLCDFSITSSASPEGGVSHNRRLSQKRLVSIEKYLKSHIEIPDSLMHFHSVGVDWTRLKELVMESDKPYRDKVLATMERAPGELSMHQMKLVLIDLEGGEIWRDMYRTLFPALRQSGAVATFKFRRVEVTGKSVEAEPIAKEDTVATSVEIAEPEEERVVECYEKIDTPTVAQQPVESKAEKKPLYLAFRTNMLYDALTVPNVGVQWSFNERWTVGVNWMYSWWKDGERNRFLRTYGGDFEVRYFLGDRTGINRFAGHHVGVYGQMLTYDIEFGKRGYLGDRWSYAAGVSYGYSLPVAKRLSIDFAVGIGYLGGKYKEYLPQDGHYVWQTTKNRRWFGPTKLEISLVWLVGYGNYNERKGGKR